MYVDISALDPKGLKNNQAVATRDKQQSGSSGCQDSPSETERRCDGCTKTISTTTDALKCSICQVWLHRYCAGIPSSRFAAVASSFICSACSITASASIVAELRSEIAALKEEISELRAALRSSEQNLEKKLSAGRSLGDETNLEQLHQRWQATHRSAATLQETRSATSS